MGITFDLQNKDRAQIKCDSKILDNLRINFTIPNKSKFGPDFFCPISILGSFKLGLTYEIAKWIKENYPTKKFSISDKLFSILFPLGNSKIKLLNPLNEIFKYRNYQKAAISEVLKIGRGIILHATGAGKSLEIFGICKSIIKQSKKVNNILIVVPNVQLVKQLKLDFCEYDKEISHITHAYSSFSNQLSLQNKNIIVTNTQWMFKHEDELPNIDMVIIDECHGLSKNNKISDFVRTLKTPLKFGFTGTLPENPDNMWNVKGLLGNVVHEKEAHELQNEGFLSKIKIKSAMFKHKNIKDFIPTKAELNEMNLNPTDRQLYLEKQLQARYNNECKYLESLTATNKILLLISNNAVGNNILLFNHIEHGKKLYELAKKMSNKKPYLIYGQTKLDERLDAIVDAEQGTEDILIIANFKCFGTGINVKKINNIIIGTSGKGLIKIIQGIGRGLRKHKSKKALTVYDIFHNYKYSLQHFEKRCSLYNKVYKISNIIPKIIKLK